MRLQYNIGTIVTWEVIWDDIIRTNITAKHGTALLGWNPVFLDWLNWPLKPAYWSTGQTLWCLDPTAHSVIYVYSAIQSTSHSQPYEHLQVIWPFYSVVYLATLLRDSAWPHSHWKARMNAMTSKNTCTKCILLRRILIIYLCFNQQRVVIQMRWQLNLRKGGFEKYQWFMFYSARNLSRYCMTRHCRILNTGYI